MVLDHSRSVDARGGTFNDILRDQINHCQNNTTHIHIYSSLSHLEQTQPQIIRDLSQTTSSETLSHGDVFAYQSDINSSTRDIAARLIVQIVQALMVPDSSNHYQNLKLELKALQETLTLVGLAIYAYEYTPLGQCLAKIVDQEANRCRLVLQQLLAAINSHRLGLNSTPIGYFWRHVLHQVEQLDSLRIQLATSRGSLAKCLKALNS
jgi:hypothetical protein